MVRKLFKHEFNYYLKSYFIFLPFLIVIALIARVSTVLVNKLDFAGVLLVSSQFALLFGCFACITLAFVVVLIRFYKNMFSQEAYLTHTLPVSNVQHLLVKVAAGFTCIAAAVVTIALSYLITADDLKTEFNNFLFLDFSTNHKTFVSITSIVSLFIALIVYGIYQIMLFFCCITIGQTSKKNKIMSAVGVYFVYYITTNTISVIILSISISLIGTGFYMSLLEIFAPILEVLIPTFEFFYVYLAAGIIIIHGIQIALFYFIIMKILNKKLNLE